MATANTVAAPVATTVTTTVATPATLPTMPPLATAYRKRHPGGGALGRCSYGAAGLRGIVVADVAMFVGGQPPVAITWQAAPATAVGQPGVLAYKRHALVNNGSGVLGRATYVAPGLPGVVTADLGLLANNAPPALAMLVAGQPLVLATPKVHTAAHVTSAVVAGANAAVAAATQAPIALPPAVAATAARAAGAIVAGVAGKAAGKGK